MVFIHIKNCLSSIAWTQVVSLGLSSNREYESFLMFKCDKILNYFRLIKKNKTWEKEKHKITILMFGWRAKPVSSLKSKLYVRSSIWDLSFWISIFEKVLRQINSRESRQSGTKHWLTILIVENWYEREYEGSRCYITNICILAEGRGGRVTGVSNLEIFLIQELQSFRSSLRTFERLSSRT